MWKQCIEMYEILDSAYVNGQQLVELLRARGADNVEMETLVQGERHTDFLRIVIAGESGKNRGLTSPTISLIGRLGGLGARPDAVGFVSDGDGALCVLSVALKLLAMIKQGDRLQGDVVISTPVSYTHLDVYKRQNYCMRIKLTNSHVNNAVENAFVATQINIGQNSP